MFCLLKQKLLCYDQNPSSHTSTIASIINSNSLNLAFNQNYLFPIDNNNFNRINDHNNKNNGIICAPYFSILSSGLNPMMHNNNNILTKL